MHRNPGVEEAPLQQELMLFDPQTSTFYVLNGTMAFLWRHCDSVASVDDLAVMMGQQFEGVDLATAMTDLQSAITDLKGLGLLLD